MPALAELLRIAKPKIVGMSVYRAGPDWQASITRDRVGHTVKFGPTPEAALIDVLTHFIEVEKLNTAPPAAPEEKDAWE